MKINFDSLPPLDVLPSEVQALVQERADIHAKHGDVSAELFAHTNAFIAAQEADREETVKLVRAGKPGTNAEVIAHREKATELRGAQAALDATFQAIENELLDALAAAAPSISKNIETTRSKALTAYGKAVDALFNARANYHAVKGIEEWANTLQLEEHERPRMLSFSTNTPLLDVDPAGRTAREVRDDALRAAFAHDMKSADPAKVRIPAFG